MAFGHHALWGAGAAAPTRQGLYCRGECIVERRLATDHFDRASPGSQGPVAVIETPEQRQQDSSSESGFTLVEALVAISIFSLLSLAIISGIRFGIKAWEQSIAYADRGDSADLAQAFLRRILSEAYPLFLPDSMAPRVDLTGTEKAMSFLSYAPSVMGTGRMRYTLSAAQKQNRTDLVLIAAPELPGVAGSTDSTGRTLISDVSVFELSYFGQKASEKIARWHNRWEQEKTLPQLIRIHVAFAKDDSRFWPELFVAPQIAVDVSCFHDPLTKRCRGR